MDLEAVYMASFNSFTATIVNTVTYGVVIGTAILICIILGILFFELVRKTSEMLFPGSEKMPVDGKISANYQKALEFPRFMSPCLPISGYIVNISMQFQKGNEPTLLDGTVNAVASTAGLMVGMYVVVVMGLALLKCGMYFYTRQ